MPGRAAFFLLYAACALAAGAEERPVALLFPASGTGIPAETLERASGAFGEGLVKAGTWRVVDRGDLDLLLRAQEILLSGAFAEGDAVRVGGLLSADLVVVLSASAADGGIVLRARALDPGSGEAKLSETVSVRAESELPLEAGRIAFRLCGVPVPEAAGGAGRGSLTVSADREGADVLLDGRPVGKTPLVLDPLPFGRYLIEIRSGSLAYASAVTVAGHERVRGTLLLETGALIVQTDPPGAQVRVGNASYGVKGLVEKLPAGRQTVTLALPGWWWRGVVPVLAGRTSRISVKLERTASLRVDAAPEVASRLSGGEVVEEFRGGRTLEGLPPGEYSLASSGPERRDAVRPVLLAPGESAVVRVDLAPNAEAEAKAAALRAEAARLAAELAALDLPVGYRDGPVPDLGGYALGGMLLSFAPLGDAFLLFPPSELPEALRLQVQPVRAAFFGLGLAAQAGLAAALLVPDGPWRTAAVAAACATAAADVVLAAVFGIPWSRWTEDMKARKAAYEEKDRRRAALEKEMARYPPP